MVSHPFRSTSSSAAMYNMHRQAIGTAMPWNWGANVFINMGGIEAEINRLGAWASVAEATMMKTVQDFLALAMAAHKARVIRLLDGVESPPEFRNRGRYGFVKRAGLLRAEKTSMPGTLFYAEGFQHPLGEVSGDLREGILNARGTVGGVQDRSLTGDYVASISYTKPDYLEALVRGHAGRWSPLTSKAIRDALRLMGNPQILPASRAVPPRDFITVAWQDIATDLEFAWDAMFRQAEIDLVAMADAGKILGGSVNYKQVYEFMSRVERSVVLGFTQRNTNNVLNVFNRHVTSVDMSGKFGDEILRSDNLWQDASNDFEGRFRRIQARMDGQNPGLQRGIVLRGALSNSSAGRGNKAYVITDRREFDILIRNVGLQLEQDRVQVNAHIQHITDSLKGHIRMSKSINVADQILVNNPEYPVIFARSLTAMAGAMVKFGFLLRNAATRGIDPPAAGRIGPRSGFLSKSLPRTFRGLHPIKSAPEEAAFKRRMTQDPFGAMGGLGALMNLGTMGLSGAMHDLGAMGTMSSLGNMGNLGGLGGFGQSL